MAKEHGRMRGKETSIPSPSAKGPSRRVLLLFIVVALLYLLQLGWWVYFHIEQSSRLREVTWGELQARRHELACGFPPDWTPVLGPLKSAPRICVVDSDSLVKAVPIPRHAGFSIAVCSGVLEELDHERRHKIVMFLSEGSFLLMLILAGLAIIYRTLWREVALKLQQSNFIAAVSHELKSPLASLRLYVETFLMGRVLDLDKRRRYSENMLSDIERLEQLVENLLEVARMERGMLRLDLEDVRLSERLELFVSELEPWLLRAGVDLEKRIEPGIEARVDLDTLRLILRNLLDNARKYGGKKPKISVELRKKGRRSLLVVRDCGVGVRRENLEQIFERFFREGDELVRRVRGSGLGLYLVRQLARAGGGNVWAESAGRGKGTAIFVEFPEAEQEDV